MSESKSPKDEPKDETKNNESLPSVPSLDTKALQAQLKQGIHSAVQTTNAALARMEETTDKVAHPLMESCRHAERRGEIFLKEAGQVYEHRKQFGPPLVLGATVLAGGLVGLRRGRLPGVAVGAVTGFATYLGVYEVELHKLPDIVFGKQD